MNKYAMLMCGVMLLLVSQASVNAKAAVPTNYTMQNPAYELDNKVVLGRIESVYFPNVPELKEVAFKGKIDTGADTTSMHADDIHVTSLNPRYQHLEDSELMQFVIKDQGGIASGWWKTDFAAQRRNLQLLVTFSLMNPYNGKKVQVQRTLDRISVVKSRSSKHPIYRPMINLALSVGGKQVNTDISLTDRGRFSAPILIGKNFLKDHAWVMPGYDYLQELPSAIMVGKKETVYIADKAFDTRFSLTNKHSILHAKQVSLHNNNVTFTTQGNNGHSLTLTYPFAGWAKFADTKRMQVYVPVKINAQQTRFLLVYLKDRSDSAAPLSIGLDNINQYFVINSRAEYLLEKPSQTFAERQPNTLVVSNDEHIRLEGNRVALQTSLVVLTSTLRVSNWQVLDTDTGKQVRYEWFDSDRQKHVSRAPLIKKIHVGGESRPVINLNLSQQGLLAEQLVALSQLDNPESSALFVLGKKQLPPIYINTRTSQLLRNLPVIKAGYIETAHVQGLTFPVKLDTGADVTSMNAQNIQYFTKNGQDMVRFEYQNEHGHKQVFERKVVATMKIKAKAGEKANVRPVVLMTVRLGHLEDTIRVNLQDRARFRYSMILGKNFLRDGVVVSSKQQYLLTKSIIDSQN